MKLELTSAFRKDYRKLPRPIRHKAKKQLRFLAQNIKHPSLRVKRMRGKYDKNTLWEARIDRFYRLSFFKQKNTLYLLRIGPHEKVI